MPGVPPVRRVAIIGAGPSGLVAAKELLRRGKSVVVLEQRQVVGGTWNYAPEPADAHGVESSAMYRSVTANVSRPFLAFSDFPFPPTVPVFPRHGHIAAYLRDYAATFDLDRHIRTGRVVCSVTPRADAGWEVAWNEAGAERRAAFDAVVVANGHHHAPRWPEEMPGRDMFGGPILHSRHYKTPGVPVPLEGRCVLVVGVGNSGCDIATDLAGIASRVILSTRSGGWVFPRWIHGRPADQVDYETRLGRWLKPGWLSRLLEPLAMRRVRRRYFGLDLGLARWGLQPDFGPYEAHAAVNEQLLPCIGNGSIVVKGAFRGFGPGRARFADGSSEPVDAAIFATGFDISFPFLASALLPVNATRNSVDLYRQILPPDLPPTIGFVGLVQPQIGFMPIIEMQARWLAALWSGGVALPSPPEMRAAIAADRQQRRNLYVDRPRHSMEVEWPDYTDGLAAELGVLPRPWRHPRALAAILLEPIHAAQYRLDGEGACPALAETALREFARNRRNECFNKP